MISDKEQKHWDRLFEIDNRAIARIERAVERREAKEIARAERQWEKECIRAERKDW